MAEVIDFYALGLDESKDVADLYKKARSEYLKSQKRSQQAKPGSAGEAKALEQRKLWEKAVEVFGSAEGRKKYDEGLVAWQRSQAGQAAKSRAETDAEAFASAAQTVLELVARAWEELSRGNISAARTVASQALKAEPGNWEAYLISGVASYRQNDLDEAMSFLRQAARLNPESAPVYACLGELYERMDRWAEAFGSYQKASELDPDDVDYKVAMGLVCVKAEVPDEGIKRLREVLEREPDHQGAKWTLAIALAESARMGWSLVGEGHPRMDAGWYAMSREQALQAVRKLHEATSLGVNDAELARDLSSVKADVDMNVRRRFIGNWVIVALFAVPAALVLNGGNREAMALAVGLGLFAGLYYFVNLVPQYAINARVLSGDNALKRGFFNWMDNLTNPYVKITVQLALFALLPYFMIYWGIRHWTGQNAPLGQDLQKITAGLSAPTGGGSPEASPDAASSRGQGLALPSPGASATPAQSAAATKPAASAFGVNAKAIGAAVAALLVILVVIVSMTRGGSTSLPATATRTTAPPSSEPPARSVAEPASLDPSWHGKWRTADGKRTMEFSAQRLVVVSEEWSPGERWVFNWTKERSLGPDQFGYTGMLVSAAAILSRYEEALERGRNNPSGYRVEPRPEVAKQWIARTAPGYWTEISALLGGDSDPGWHWILDANGNILEFADHGRGFTLNLLTRVTTESAGPVQRGPSSLQAATTGQAIPAPNVRVGDSYIYETLDLIEPKFNNVTSREVVDVDGRGFVMKVVNTKSGYTRQLFYDQELNLRSTRSGDNDGSDFSPPLRYFKFPIEVGDTWTMRSTETNVKTGKTKTHTIRATAEGFERVNVPAGSFNTVRIRIESDLDDQGQVSSGRDVSWYAPDVRRTVRSELESRDATGKIGRRQVSLIDYKLQ